MAQKLKGGTEITIGYMGDGATSEADFHVAMEFASRLSAPVLFFCQNNQWAISTGWKQQTIAKSIACKAHGYGMDGYRVDGNDVLAVHQITLHAANQIRSTGRPVFIEALTYRVGAHSTSDDPSRYRDESITEQWKKRDPITRFRNTLYELDYWSPEQDSTLVDDYVATIKQEIKRAEAVGPPSLDTLFEDVYAQIPRHLLEQKQALLASLNARKEH
jgi:TPP-dependent pyruvate/acetoin dehydrogenase alpha subunit